jgi:hypothetical protein
MTIYMETNAPVAAKDDQILTKGVHFVGTWIILVVSLVVEPGCTSCLPANRGFEEISSLLGFAAGKLPELVILTGRKLVLAGKSAKLVGT